MVSLFGVEGKEKLSKENTFGISLSDLKPRDGLGGKQGTEQMSALGWKLPSHPGHLAFHRVTLQVLVSRVYFQDFWCPVVKNPSCNAGDMGSTPGQGTKIPHAEEQLKPMRHNS